MAVWYCPLCRRTSFTGRRHLYSAAHRRRLQEALGRLEEEVAAARAALGDVSVRRYDPAEHERSVWCLCCGRGVRRDGRSGALALPHAGILQHLAGAEHRRETARFWRENRADAALRERFVVTKEEFERFAAAVEKAVGAYEEREEQNIRQVRDADTPRRPLLVTSPPSSPLCARRWRPASGRRSGGSGTSLVRPSRLVPPRPDFSWMESGQALTFIGHQVGAQCSKPPWLTDEDEEDGSKQQIGPSYEEFLKQKEKQKLKKLPAERVGANFDHTSQTGDSWLPSFGRVWNHGRRWQSRHQFRAESGAKKKKR
uniref:Centrosomal AT-AC splicing factor n=1 Tax=Coturnix japonica TaxID=93934 RepID=A0A8C2TLX2_COTJA